MAVRSVTTESPYMLRMNYGPNILTFYFATFTHMVNFRNGYQAHREYLQESLQNRFKMKFLLSAEFCDIDYYRRVEPMGFCVDINGRSTSNIDAFSGSLQAVES